MNSKELYKKELYKYILITPDNILNVPLGSHIKTIDINNNLRSCGFLVKKDILNKNVLHNNFVIKSNIYYKIFIKYHNDIYYKIIDKMTKKKIFVELLEKLNDKK